jgi:hypothetical protein
VYKKKEEIMKFTLMLAALLLTSVSFADTGAQKKVKKEMLERAKLMLEKVDGARDDLDRKDPVNACIKVEELYSLYPDHLKSIGVYMKIMKKKSRKSRDAALSELAFMHKQSLICSQGDYGDNVDTKALDKELKSVRRSLKKQLRAIKSSSTDQNNSFRYRYEF